MVLQSICIGIMHPLKIILRLKASPWGRFGGAVFSFTFAYGNNN